MNQPRPLNDFDSITQFLTGMPRRRVAVVFPHDSHTLEAVTDALSLDLANFTLVGRAADASLAEIASRFPERVELVDADSADQAALIAVRLVRDGNADVLMKGLINTDNLLRAILNKQEGILAPGAVLSHVTASQIPGFGRMLLFSDPAVIPYPTPEQHSAIVGYLADACRALGIDRPRIALIHCNEKTSEKFPVTLGYAEIKARSATGCYGDAIVDGPMDIKTALDIHSGQVKGIESPIDGRADALVFPDIQAGNTFYKTISFFTNSVNAGMLMGAKAPVVLSSRSDSTYSKMCSLAMACMMNN